MKFCFFEFEFESECWFWISFCSFEWGDQVRSLLHIERGGGIWRLQILFFPNGCWVIGGE